MKYFTKKCQNFTKNLTSTSLKMDYKYCEQVLKFETNPTDFEIIENPNYLAYYFDYKNFEMHILGKQCLKKSELDDKFGVPFKKSPPKRISDSFIQDKKDIFERGGKTPRLVVTLEDFNSIRSPPVKFWKICEDLSYSKLKGKYTVRQNVIITNELNADEYTIIKFFVGGKQLKEYRDEEYPEEEDSKEVEERVN